MDVKSGLKCGIVVDKRRAGLLRHLLQKESQYIEGLTVGEANRYVAAREYSGAESYLHGLNELHKELYDIEEALRKDEATLSQESAR